MISTIRLSVCGAVAAALVAGCAGSTAPPSPTTIVQPSSSVAQIAVGTVNLFGTATGLNVTSTLRTPNGNSVLVTTPFITGPFKLPTTTGTPDGSGATIETGPTASEVASESITGSGQVTPGSTQVVPSTFGVSGGDFANGFLPQNANNVGNVSFNPYIEPLYDPLSNDSSSSDPNAFTAWGGPPAFDPNHDGQGVRDGTYGPGILGVTEGINVFQGVTVNPGTYTLRVVIPTVTTKVQVTASTTLGGVTSLPNATAPAFTPDGNGGGSFDVAMPKGTHDGLLQIVDVGLPLNSSGGQGGNCNGAGNGPLISGPSSPYSSPVWYTIHVTTSGVYKLPDSDAPGNPTHRHPSICTATQNGSGAAADVIKVQLIAADYPLYPDQYLFNLKTQVPPIAGANGSNDLTISPVGDGTAGSGAVRHRR